MNFQEKVMNTVKTALAQLERLDAEEDAARRKWSNEEIGGKAYSALLSDIQSRRDGIRTAACTELRDVQAEHKESVEKATELDASMIDPDAELLRMDEVTLSERQFKALVEKHRSNPLMEKLLRNYQEKHPGLYAEYLPSPEQRVIDFEHFVGAGCRVVHDPHSLQAGLFLEGMYTPKDDLVVEREKPTA